MQARVLVRHIRCWCSVQCACGVCCASVLFWAGGYSNFVMAGRGCVVCYVVLPTSTFSFYERMLRLGDVKMC